ncbi:MULTISPECIES: hypothetical protein [unclassified Aeromonas]|uniref:hypothetical protein n=1 Tax=unclassified Aeromonas TaxID=257493 RepID=UPI0022E4C70F|nr:MULTISPECIES: hypothetical protein [unclassified Aeromonas]
MDNGKLEFTKEQVELFREWFDAVQDLNPAYLNKGDYALGKELYERLGLRVPNSISTNAGGRGKRMNGIIKKLTPLLTAGLLR